MSLVDVIMTIGEKDVISEQDCLVLDSLEQMYPKSRSALRVGLLPRLYKALEKARGAQHTFLGRRPLELVNSLVVEDEYEHLVVVLPLGSTSAAVNVGYTYLTRLLRNSGLDNHDLSGAIREFAHQSIVPQLDILGEFTRYPFDHKIAYDLMFTLKLALTKGQLGRGKLHTIETKYLYFKDVIPPVNIGNRETRQIAILFKYHPLPH